MKGKIWKSKSKILRKVRITQPEEINGRIVRKRIRKRIALPSHVFRDVQAYKHIKKCLSCGKRFEDKYKARLYCNECRK